MRVLISAYACEPDCGSEPEVGLQAVLTAAAQHDVWVITRQNNIPSLLEFLEHHPLRSRIHLRGLDVEGLALRVKRRWGLAGMHWYYDLWQRRLSDFAIRLDREVGFDVVHHVTFATYWTRTGVAQVDKPLVWGPVGGGVRPPLGLLPVIGLRGVVGDMSRVLMRPAMSWLVRARHTGKRAAVVLVQNPDTARRLGAEATAIVLPNALAAGHLTPQHRGGEAAAHPRLVTAGRLIGWKGTTLAMAALRNVNDSAATLDVYGAGPQEARLLRLRDRLAMTERVRFHGAVPRSDLLSAMEGASALVHPAVHEEAGFVVAEALALGTPVVGLNHGGPPVIAGFFPDVPSRMIEPSTPRITAARIAAAIDDLLDRERVSPPAEHGAPFGETLLAAYEKAAGMLIG
jgi:glycosyltransferase involved in cell wall biosynthesis